MDSYLISKSPVQSRSTYFHPQPRRSLRGDVHETGLFRLVWSASDSYSIHSYSKSVLDTHLSINKMYSWKLLSSLCSRWPGVSIVASAHSYHQVHKYWYMRHLRRNVAHSSRQEVQEDALLWLQDCFLRKPLWPVRAASVGKYKKQACQLINCSTAAWQAFCHVYMLLIGYCTVCTTHRYTCLSVSTIEQRTSITATATP